MTEEPKGKYVCGCGCLYTPVEYAHKGDNLTGQDEIVKMQSADKHDEGKSPLGLLDRNAMVGLAEILKYGAAKYNSPHNWRKGLNYSRCYNAALRHLMAFIDGEDTDAESGLPHVDHAMCCLMFLSNFHKTRPDLDDRRK